MAADLSWVIDTKVVREGDPAKDALFANDGWHLLHVTGGLHGPVEYVFGWGDRPER
jgi:hypothetical protein